MRMYLCFVSVGDEGQAVGTYMHVDCVINNNIHKSETFVGIEYEHNVGEDEKV